MRRAIWMAAATLALAAACAQGCDGGGGGTSDDDDDNTTGSGGNAQGGAGGQGGSGGQGASGGTGAAGGSGGSGGSGGGAPQAQCDAPLSPGVVLVMNQIFLGETNPDGSTSPQAWRQYGFNVDGLVSTTASVDLCQPHGSASPGNVYPDGDGGIDNSYGRNIVPIMGTLAANPSAEATARIQEGGPTLLLHLAALGPEADQGPLQARLYLGSDLGAPPAFDGTDTWPVEPTSLQSPPDLMASKVCFPESTVSGDAFSSGVAITGPLLLYTDVSGFNMALTIHHPRVSLQLDPAHDGGVNGRIGGVLVTEELADEIRRIVGAFDSTLCTGSTIDSILEQIRNASDILADGTQDPTKPCDAISIGLGFTMAPVTLGPVASPIPLVDTCPP